MESGQILKLHLVLASLTHSCKWFCGQRCILLCCCIVMRLLLFTLNEKEHFLEHDGVVCVPQFFLLLHRNGKKSGSKSAGDSQKSQK